MEVTKQFLVLLALVCVAFCYTKQKDNANGLVGGSSDVDVKDKDIEDAANFAIERLNAMSNSMHRSAIVKIVSAKKQLVAGNKYTITFLIGETECRNNDVNKHATVEVCPPASNRKVDKCTIEVLSQIWLPEPYDLLSHKCEMSRRSGAKKRTKHVNADAVMQAPMKKVRLGGRAAFETFKTQHGKTYADEAEEQKRFAIFEGNMKVAQTLQAKERGSATYGATKFADLTREEFKKYLGLRTDTWTGGMEAQQAKIPEGKAPDAFDWREHGAVTPVKNQGSCGSCWAFSTTGNIEGQWKIKRSNLVSLSEQELVDCDKLDEGCNGGLPTNAYQEIMRLGGLETEGKYPYDARDEKCAFKKQDARVQISGYVNISKDEDDMASWLAKNGPISIGINAMAMQFYFGGVSHPWSFLCSPEALDHGVLIVGYGVEKGYFSNTPYWIIKNSWGPGWGEKGYYRVYRGDGTCGLNQMCTSAVVDAQP